MKNPYSPVDFERIGVKKGAQITIIHVNHVMLLLNQYKTDKVIDDRTHGYD